MLAKKLLTTAGAEEKTYVDDIFSVYLRTGTGAGTTVTTNVDMTQGYMLWTKGRSGATDHAIYDSARGVTLDLASNTTGAQTTQSTGLKSVSTTGHTIGSLAKMNTSGATYVDYVFRKAPKFFDVVTYTGNGSGSTNISHSLGVVPGMVVIKRTDTSSNWIVHHRVADSSDYTLLRMNETVANIGNVGVGNFTSTTFIAGNWGTIATGVGNDNMNVNGATYVAYLFAHDPSPDGIIQAGSFTTDGSGNATVDLGWEPQYLMVKAAVGDTGSWNILDTQRGLTALSGSNTARLFAESANAENTTVKIYSLNSTGFSIAGVSPSVTHIYLAIRRPNKPPTSGTQVFNAYATTSAPAAGTAIDTGFPPDTQILLPRYGDNKRVISKLPGITRSLFTNLTNIESTPTPQNWNNTGFLLETGFTGFSVGMLSFRRAPGFFDVVAYTGNGVVGRQVAHSLGVVPEIIIVKCRDTTSNWAVYHRSLDGNSNLFLNTTDGVGTIGSQFINTPTSATFNVSSNATVNASGATYVTYLFASLPGISKIFSYVGNGTSQNIECGFTTGARFIMVKAASTTGDWLIADTARGVTAGADPRLSLNTTAAEVTTEDWVDSYSGGFTVNQVAGSNANVNGVTYIGMAIA